LVLLALGLLMAATWWYLNRQQEGEQGAVTLPENPVAIINSTTTPIPERRSPLTVKDTLGDLLYAPESEKWSGALREAHRARTEGRYSAAIAQYSALVGSQARQEANDALWGLAGTYAQAGQTGPAIRAYSLFTYLRDDPRAPRAFFALGKLYQQEGSSARAASAYGEYVRLAGPARDAVKMMRAPLLLDDEEILILHKSVVDGKAVDADRREAMRGLAIAYARLGDRERARQVYDDLAKERTDYPRPVLDHTDDPPEVLAADESRLLGDVADARKRLLDYLNSDGGIRPYHAGLYSALDALLTLSPTAVVSGTISPMSAATVAYNAGYLGNAIEYLEVVRSTQSDPAVRAEAALLTGKAFERLGDPATAYNWYTATLQTYPGSPQAPEAARRAGDALEEQAAWDAALGAYNQAATSYPTSPETALARLHGAVLAYRLEQRDDALNMLAYVTSSDAVSPTIKAQASFWTAKVQRSVGNPAWKEGLEETSKLVPGSYHDFRARSLLAGEPDGGPLALTFSESGVDGAHLGVDYQGEAAERTELLSWAAGVDGGEEPSPTRATATATGQTPQGDRIEPRLASDPEVQRAVALLRLEAEPQATNAFRALAERLSEEGDASGLAQVVIYLRYHAPTRTAMVIAEMLAAMDQGGDPLDRPTLLLKTLYPTPYEEMVMPEASTRQIDPLLVYALMRQESQFVPDAQSHADARGLAQVIPSTGQGIADQLGDSSFSPDDLYLPHVSVRYGTYYLASNLPQFEGKLLPALAAYNGGPGNAARWLAGSALFDPDLYVERIDLFETEDYLQRVYQNYGFYGLIYGGRP
jgi:soluble lytic murein transglycosylase